jgi:hypothetical protein
MLEFIGGSFVAGKEGSLRHKSMGSDTPNDFFDFDSAALDALDSWIEPQLLIDYLDLFARPIHQNQDPTEEVFPFEFLEKSHDSPVSETPDVHRFEPLPTGPVAPNFLILPEHTKLREPIASIDNRPQPDFAGFEIEIWDPKREVNGVDAEKEYSKTTKKRKLSPTAPRKKPKATDDGNRKRAPHGTTCVRCRLQKGKAC